MRIFLHAEHLKRLYRIVSLNIHVCFDDCYFNYIVSNYKILKFHNNRYDRTTSLS